jgi:uncharacterized protein YqhQ
MSAHLQMMPVLESGEETLVGGQAVMEGVMMRAPHSYCVSVRKPSGELVTQEQSIPRMSEKYPIFKWPVLRGIGTLGQAMMLAGLAWAAWMIWLQKARLSDSPFAEETRR